MHEALHLVASVVGDHNLYCFRFLNASPYQVAASVLQREGEGQVLRISLQLSVILQLCTVMRNIGNNYNTSVQIKISLKLTCV